MVAIEAKHLTKVYRSYSRRADLIKEILLLNCKQYHARRVALEDVSLTVQIGESVGILGRNGAGKSTLLKLLAGISPPTSGTLMVQGKIAALLELGTGFHPDYSGIENVRMNGMLLGLTRKEIENQLHSIIDFAELGKAIEQPVRTYSSGMQARLAFAISTALRPEILIIDEVLAVGDSYFVNKCLQYIRQCQYEGRTLLFVSHNLPLLSKVCRQAVWLDEGRIMRRGDIAEVCEAYQAAVERWEEERTLMVGHPQGTMQQDMVRQFGQIGQKYSQEITIVQVLSLGRDSRVRSVFHTGEQLIMRVHYRAIVDCADPVVGVTIKNGWGDVIFTTTTFDEGFTIRCIPQGSGFIDVILDPLLFDEQTYSVDVSVAKREVLDALLTIPPEANYDRKENACRWKVTNKIRPSVRGVIRHPVRWQHVVNQSDESVETQIRT